MYDWNDLYNWIPGFRTQAVQSFPTLKNYIEQACDYGDMNEMMEFLLHCSAKNDLVN